MSLHHDFPFEATYLYCKTCKAKTLHNKPMHEYICSKCSRIWDELLMEVNLKQNKYGKLHYECVILSDKPVKSQDITVTYFDTLEECLDWFRDKATELKESAQ